MKFYCVPCGCPADVVEGATNLICHCGVSLLSKDKPATFQRTASCPPQEPDPLTRTGVFTPK